MEPSPILFMHILLLPSRLHIETANALICVDPQMVVIIYLGYYEASTHLGSDTEFPKFESTRTRALAGARSAAARTRCHSHPLGRYGRRRNAPLFALVILLQSAGHTVAAFRTRGAWESAATGRQSRARCSGKGQGSGSMGGVVKGRQGRIAHELRELALAFRREVGRNIHHSKTPPLITMESLEERETASRPSCMPTASLTDHVLPSLLTDSSTNPSKPLAATKEKSCSKPPLRVQSVVETAFKASTLSPPS
eukprot:632772-Pleurochrysis_carterae.AAC.2